MFWVSFVRLMSPVWRLWVSEGLWDWHTHWAGDGGSLHNFSLLQFVSPLLGLVSTNSSTLYQFYANSILQTTLLLKSTAIVHLLFVLLKNICRCIMRRLYILQSLTFNSSPSSRVSTLSSEEVAVLVHSYHGHMMIQLRSTVTHWFEWRGLDLLN